jgi:NifU-like protein involved in Fe-S cluster formation
MSAPYDALVAELFHEAAHAGAPVGCGWGRGEAREPLTATHVRWHVRVVDGRIEAARYEVRGCPHTLAVAALLARELPGRPAAEPAIDIRALAARVGAPVAKLGRLFAIEDALHSALGAAALILGDGTT